MTGLQLKALPPKDAIAYFRSKGYAISFDWRDVWQEMHAQAFTVAKMASRDLLETTRALVDQALAEGWTYEQFRAQLKPQLQAAGWWGRKKMTDPLTGEEKLVQLGSDRRMRTIFQTNLRVAQQVGNWQRAWKARDLMPFMMFKHNSHLFPRPEHVAWDGTVLPITDPWWREHYPPCAWGCKCSTLSFNQRMLDARKLKVNQPPKFPPKVYISPRTGEISQIETGIEPGWNYNVGLAPLRPLTVRPEYPLQGGKPAPITVRDAAAQKFLGAFGATPEKGKIVKDRDGWPLTIDDGMFRNARGDRAVPRPDLVADLPAVAMAIKSYQKAEWVWSDAKAQATFDTGIKKVIDVANAPGDSPARLRFSRAARWLVKAARQEGLDVDDFAHTVDVSGIRHIRNRHSNDLAEALHGQVAIKPEDFKAVPKIVEAPDMVGFGLKNQLGRDLVTFFKATAEGVYVYMAEIRNGRWELAASTLWKSPAAADVQSVSASLVQHVQNNDGGARLKVVDLRGKIKPPAAQLVRRYTARLDKREITVDFSSDSWTFDIQPIT